MLKEEIGEDIGYATIEPEKPAIAGSRQAWVLIYYIM